MRDVAGRSAGSMGETAAAPVVFRGGLFMPRSQRLIGVAAIVLAACLWQAASSFGWVSPFFAPSPLRVLAALVAMAQSGELVGHIAASLQRLFGGYILGMSAGIFVGILVGLFTLTRSAGIALVSALFPIPKIALLPLFILWFGIGEGSKIATIAFGTFFPTVVATYAAVDNVDRSLVRMGRSFGLTSFAIVRKIILPGALPGILAGLRIASSIGIVLLVAAEMIGANQGIGALVLAAGNLMQTDQLLAGVVLLSAIGLLIAGALGALERRLLAWR